MISKATIEEMRQILKEDYGKDVSQSEASEITRNLVSYFDLLAKINHRKKIKNNHDYNKPKNN